MAAMIVHPQEVLGFYTRDSIIGSAIAVACLVAAVAFLFTMFRDVWRVVQNLIQTTVCAIRGEQSPRSRRREAIKRMREKVFSPEEAIARVRKYAEAKGYSAQDPFDVQLRFLQTAKERKEDLSIGRFVYSMNIGNWRPGTVVEIDAIDGTVLKWLTRPR